MFLTMVRRAARKRGHDLQPRVWPSRVIDHGAILAYERVMTRTDSVDDRYQENCEELFKKYNVKENLDNLHAVVTAARARKQAGYDGKDVWREDLQPRAAVRARTIPLLEQERERLRAELAQVSSRFDGPTVSGHLIALTDR